MAKYTKHLFEDPKKYLSILPGCASTVRTVKGAFPVVNVYKEGSAKVNKPKI
jgi:hypothetical protein